MPSIRALVALTGALTVALTACTSNPQPTSTPAATPSASAPSASGDGTLRVGSLLTLTGDRAAYGAAQAAGIDLAVRELNEAGGLNGRPVVAHHREGTADAVAELAGRGVDVVITADRELATRAEEAGMAAIGPAWFPALAAGTQPADEFAVRLRESDPGLTELATGAEAYDAVVLAALAAILAGDDGAASVRHALPLAAEGGIACGSVGECLHVLETETDIAYAGPSGSVVPPESG